MPIAADPTIAQAAIFKALGHPTRLSMVQALAGGPRCVCELNGIGGEDLSTTSRHLAVLTAAGVLASERQANKVFYRLAMPCVLTFTACIAKHLAKADG